MVSAPTGRVCKKKCISRSCNDGNSYCHSLHDSAFIECNLPSLSLRFLPLHAASLLHLVSCPSFRPPARVLSCAPFPLFIPFFRTTSLRRRRSASHPGAECDTRRSLVNVQEARRKKVSCMASCHRPNQTSIYMYKRGRTYTPDRFS